MEKYNRNKPFAISDQEIIDCLPDGDFIAVLGTSHTTGICKRGEFEKIDNGDRWTEQLELLLGMPVINFAIPGNYNAYMVQQLIDIVELPGVKERCKMIIVESRRGNLAGLYYFDIFADVDHRKEYMNRHIASGHHIDSRSWVDMYVGVYTPIKANRTDYCEHLVRNSNKEVFDFFVPPEAVETMEKAVQATAETYCTSVQPVVEDLTDIRTMRTIANLAGIPFRYFFWDPVKTAHTVGTDDVIALFNTMYNLDDNRIAGLADTINQSFIAEHSKEEWIEAECECRHRDEKVHKWVAEKIYKEINNVIIGEE